MTAKRCQKNRSDRKSSIRLQSTYVHGGGVRRGVAQGWVRGELVGLVVEGDGEESW